MILKGFTIYGHSGHFGYVTKTICMNFHSLNIEDFLSNLSSTDQMVSKKICFIILVGIQ